MLTRLRNLILPVACFLLAACAYAETPEIVKAIIADSIVKIQQPAKLADRLNAVSAPAQENISLEENMEETSAATHIPERVVGYRVQVFSDNNIRTAKAEARSKAAAVGSAIPHYKTYVSYEAPFWRLRVGDFRSKADASVAADEIKRAFPQYSREIRVVRDRVNL